MATKRYREYYIKDFSGGENSTDSDLVLVPSELSETQDVVPTTRGAITRRLGYTKYNTTGVGGNAATIYALHRFYREASGGTDVLLAMAGAKIWNVPTSGASTDLGLDHDAAANYTVTAEDGFMRQYRDRVYGCTKNSEMFVVAEHPGASTALLAWEAGVHPPTNALTEVEKGAGNVDGTVSYKHSYWYGESAAFGESNVVATALTETFSDKEVTLTIFGAGKDYADWAAAHDAGIDKVSIYRTEDGGEVYYFLADVTSGLTYDDNIADADLEHATTPETDNYPPNLPAYLCVHDVRMFAADLYDGSDRFPKRVRWSRVGFPDIWPAQNYADAPAEHGECRGLAVVGGALYVFYESAIARLNVHEDADATFEIVTSEAGVKAPRSLVVGKDGGVECAFFVSYDNQVYRFNGDQAQRISMDIEGRYALRVANLDDSCGIWDGETYRVCLRTNTTPPFYTDMLRYNTKARKQSPEGYSTGSWWFTDVGTAEGAYCFCWLNGGADTGQILWGGSANGAALIPPYVWQADNGNGDDTTDVITAYAQTGYEDCGTPDLKRFSHITVVAESDTALTVTWETDGVSGTWGSQTGTFTTTTGTNPIATTANLPMPKGRHIRLKVSGSDADDPWKWYSRAYKFEVIPVAGVHG